jgi:hypothetical protein
MVYQWIGGSDFSIHFHSASNSLSILHFLLDQKVKQKIKSHRRRSRKIFSSAVRRAYPIRH